MTSLADPHPSRDELTALSDGRLAGPDATAVESHVATCDVCAAALGELGARNELVLRLRSAVDGDKTSPCVSLTAGIDEIRKFLEPSTYPGSQGRLGHYEILECLGQGAFGIVFRAFDDSLQRVVALKVLAPAMAATSPPRKRFLREARVAAQLRHEHVVRIYAVEELPTPYLVMEYIPGETLQERLDRVGPLEAPVVLRLGCQMAQGLAAAHEQGLIHRDIKPGNILLESGLEERVKITDFGLARAADDAQLTQSGIVAGTPMYMAPEQARGETIDQRADLFSLGSVLYTMVSGRPPFRASNTVAVLKRVCDDAPRPIPELIPETPQWLCDIIARLQAKHPEERFQSASEVAGLLEECLSHGPQVPSGAVAVTAVPTVPRPSPRTGQPNWRARWSIAAAVMLCLLSALGVTEATGVTHLAGTVVRIVTGEGTLVIETDDPTVKVALDGEELTISGGGVQELRLRPGQYQFVATRNGQPVKQELVTITRGGEKVVTVSREAVAPETAASLGSGEIRRFAPYWGAVTCVAVSPDGQRALFGGEDTVVWLVDLSGKDKPRTFEGHTKQVLSVAFSPDGRRALSGGVDATVRLWDLESGQELRQFEGHTEIVWEVAFSPDGRLAASGGGHLIEDGKYLPAKDTTVRLWDVETGTELRRLTGHNGHILSIAFSPDGTRALTGCSNQDPIIRLWDVASGNELGRLEGHSLGVNKLVFSADGRRALSAAGDRTIRLWEVETRNTIGRFLGHTRDVTGVAFSPDERYCVSSSWDNTVRLWDVESRKELHCFEGHTGLVRDVAFSPDGRTVLSGADDGTMRLWRLPDDLAQKAAQRVPGAFVILAGQGVAERKFDTLAEAVQRASDGDTIEIRGNGPFVTEPISIQRTALTIRAGAGFRPAIQLSPEVRQRKGFLLATNAALVLEGLELHCAPPPGSASGGWTAVHVVEAPLRAVNCRFCAPIWAHHSPVCMFRNCELICASGGGVAGEFNSGSKFIFENCLHGTSTFPIGFQFDRAALRDTSIQIKRSTFANNGTSLRLVLRSPIPSPSDQPQDADATRLDISESIFDSPGVLNVEQTREFLEQAALPEPAEAEATLLRLLQWRGERNLFAAGSASVRWSAVLNPQPPHGPKNLEDWKQFWGAAEAGSLEGSIRFEGGNLRARADTDVERLTPDDFRLRPDSAGYRAGPDGKDLGADIDLVGPGPAYERWKQTPDYQEWLRETGQLRSAAPAPEPGAFVLLTGQGAEVRKFDSLAEAITHSNDGDTIEIRGNGPFVSDGVTIVHPLVIRAGAGYTPSIILSREAADRNVPLVDVLNSLVVEGLELRRTGGARGQIEGPRPRLIAGGRAGNLRMVNCRLVFNGQGMWGYLLNSGFVNCTLRNCELIIDKGAAFDWFFPRGARLSVENCVTAAGGLLNFSPSEADAADVVLSIRSNTVVGNCLGLGLYDDLNLPSGTAAEPFVRLELFGNVTSCPPTFGRGAILRVDQVRPKQPLTAQDAEVVLPTIVALREKQNVYARGTRMLGYAVVDQVTKALDSSRESNLADWDQVWNQSETGSVEGDVRFQGGDVLERALAGPDKLTAEDFRLREDSAGYRAGPDGKDLGADVDLVGPGAAYEHWKQTPEYQDWLKETGQVE